MFFRCIKSAFVFFALVSLVATAAPAVAETGDESEDDRLGWFSQVRVKLMAKNYGLDEAEAEKLYRILQDEKEMTKNLQRDLRALYDNLAASVEESAGDDVLVASMNDINRKQVEIAQRDADMVIAVKDVLGPAKTAKWLLSKRGLIDQFKGSVKKARETMDEKDTQGPEKKGYEKSRQGNAGYF